MKLIDGAAVSFGNQLIKGLFRIRQIVFVPISVREAEVIGAVAQTLGDGQHLLGIISAGWPEQLHFIAVGVQHVVVDRHDLLDDVVDGQFWKIRMIGAVIGEDMTLVDDPPDEFWVILNKMIIYEKDSLYICLLEYIQKYGCQIVVLIATVETDIDIAVIRGDEVSIIMLILFCQLHSVDWTVSAVYIAARSVTV